VATRNPCVALPARRDYGRAVDRGVFRNVPSDAVSGGGILRVQHRRRRCASGRQHDYRRSRQYWQSTGPDPQLRSSHSSRQPAQPVVIERGMQRCLLFSEQQQADSLEM